MDALVPVDIQEQVPRKQGLKLYGISVDDCHDVIQEQVPRKQGLKQERGTEFITQISEFKSKFHENKD